MGVMQREAIADHRFQERAPSARYPPSSFG
jgi:hypothetical protein